MNEQKQRRYVLTGGPSVGKTTVCDILSSLGKIVIPEAARVVIDEQLTSGGDILPWTKPKEFQEILAEKQLEMESKFDQLEVFLDRSLLDGLVFCNYYNVPIPPMITEDVIGTFDKIFLLDKLPQYSRDQKRVLEEHESAEIHSMIEKEYTNRGFDVVHVPVLPPEERANFILKAIKS
jgi:predicted ATPase